MTTLGDLLGDKADMLTRDFTSVGDVHILPMGEKEGITTKGGKDTKDKFFIVLGFNKFGDIIGGVVINSNVNHNLPSSVTDYLMPMTKKNLPFLKHNSFVNCSRLKTVSKTKINKDTFRGQIDDCGFLELIVGTVIESPYSNKQQLKEFGILPQ